MSSHTPSRISLRRKRLNNDYQQAIPSPKRMSPSADSEEKHSKAAEQMKKSNYEHETRNSCVSSAFLTPKTCRRRNVNNGTATPLTGKKEIQPCSLVVPREYDERKVEEFSCSQSPSQFPSSQIPSTQDCEVVWDCNSPGYTREELKQMNVRSDEKFLRSPVTRAPNRLFAKYKRAPPPLQLPSGVGEKNSDVVSAQLDNLLTKVNSELLKEVESESEEEYWPDDSALGILKASSQPFNVSGRHSESNSTEVTSQKSKPVTLVGEALIDAGSPVMGKAPVDADSPLMGEALVDAGSSSQVHEHRNKSPVKEKEAAVDASFSSLDDDDLFSESFLRSTQALEEAILKDEAKQASAGKNRLSPLSRIRRKTPVFLSNRMDVAPGNNNNNDNLIKSEICITSNPNRAHQFTSNRCPPTVSASKGANSILCESLSERASTSMVVPARVKSFQPDNARDLSQKGFAKQNKQRMTFQLTASNEGCFSKCFEFSELTLGRNPSSERIAQKQKFGRSKSDTYQRSSVAREEKSSLSQVATQNISQEFDDDEDDEIFASLMPDLIKVETEHLRKPRGGNASSFPEYDLEKTSLANSAPQKPSNNFLRQQNPCDGVLKPSEGSKDFPEKCNKSTFAAFMNKKPQKSKEGLGGESVGVFSLNNENDSVHLRSRVSSNGTSRRGSFSSETESRDPEDQSKAMNAEHDFDDDDDDDIFLQDGVLDYISLMESQFVSSQTSNETAANVKDLPPPNKGHQLSKWALTNSSSGKLAHEQVDYVKDERKKTGYSASPLGGRDTGAAMLQKELLKVSEATDRLNKALKFKVTHKSVSGGGSDAPTETISDEEIFQLACKDTSIGTTNETFLERGQQYVQKGPYLHVQKGPYLHTPNKSCPRRAFQIE